MNRLYQRLIRWALWLVLLPINAFAQGHGGGPGSGGGGMGGQQRGGPPSFNQQGPGFPGRNVPEGRAPGGPPSPGSGPPGTDSTLRGGVQLGPPGRFWDDKGFAKSLGLRKEQQKKMDAIFNANKGLLLENYKSLQREEKKLEAITKEKNLQENRIFSGIDSVVQARGNLEKANAHMLLLIRQEMDEQQVLRMDSFREHPPSEQNQ